MILLNILIYAILALVVYGIVKLFVKLWPALDEEEKGQNTIIQNSMY